MGRREVIEITCDRCGKVQTQSKSEIHTGEGPEFIIQNKGKKTEYADLCRTCRRTVTNYVERILKVTPEEKPKDPPKTKTKAVTLTKTDSRTTTN